MRRNWIIALMGAALLAIAPASALAHGHHARHHAKSHHRVRTQLHHFTAATSGTPATGATTVPSGNAGTVTSFDGTTGKLVITLNDGSTASGVFNPNTELKCESASSQSSGAPGSMQSDLSRDGGGDQNSGTTQSSSGDQPSSSGDQTSSSGNEPSSSGQQDTADQNDQDEQGDAGNGQAACTTANLTPGAVVHEAELSVSSGGSLWRQVALVIG